MNRKFVYKYTLSDKSAGYWITGITPKLAGYELPKRFPGREIINIKWMNR